MNNSDIKILIQAMADLDEGVVMQQVQKICQSDVETVFQSLYAFQTGMNIVGERYDQCEYFVGDLIYAGDIMSNAINTLKLALQKVIPKQKTKGRIILCTVEGDIHDIGKNIVKTALEAENIEVVDLGVNVSPEQVVQAALQENIGIVALSGVLSFAVSSMQRTVEALHENALAKQIKVVVGGACVNKEAFEIIGADYWAETVQETVSICCQWLSETTDDIPRQNEMEEDACLQI